MPIKICVVEQRGTGGMIHYAYQLCSAMAKEGADVTLVTAQKYELDDLPHNFSVNKLMNLWSQADPLLSKLPQTRWDVFWRKIFWTFRRGFRAIRLIWQWIRLTNYLIRARPDVVQFGATEFAFEAIFFHQLRRRGILISQICHEFESRENTRGFFTTVNNRLFYSAFDAFPIIFLHGEANKKRFISMFDIPAERLHVIPHGNERIFQDAAGRGQLSEQLIQKYGLSAQTCMVLFFGNITPSKGLPDLIEAFAAVYAHNKQARLVIAGMPSKYVDMNSLVQLAEKSEAAKAIIFDTRYIPIHEVSSLMQLASVMVFPYLSGTQSGTIQVAYAFGKPVVATSVGGFPEEVEDGLSGLLVPPGSPKELSVAIQRILDDPVTAQKMGDYARQLSETRFSWETIARKILDVYEDYIR